MMAQLLLLLRRLAAYALLCACLEFLLPEGKSRGYVRFAAGALLLKTVVLPVASMLAEVFS